MKLECSLTAGVAADPTLPSCLRDQGSLDYAATTPRGFRPAPCTAIGATSLQHERRDAMPTTRHLLSLQAAPKNPPTGTLSRDFVTGNPMANGGNAALQSLGDLAQRKVFLDHGEQHRFVDWPLRAVPVAPARAQSVLRQPVADCRRVPAGESADRIEGHFLRQAAFKEALLHSTRIARVSDKTLRHPIGTTGARRGRCVRPGRRARG